MKSTKDFYVTFGIGMSKYVVSYHNGEKKHADGSPFYDVMIFSNKKKMNEFIKLLKQNNYKEL